MRAGQLRHLVTIDKPFESQNETGEELLDWLPYARPNAAIEPLTGRELASQASLESSLDTRIRCRWSPRMAVVRTKWRIRFNGVVYNIQSIIDLKMGNREIQFLCESGLNNG